METDGIAAEFPWIVSRAGVEGPTHPIMAMNFAGWSPMAAIPCGLLES